MANSWSQVNWRQAAGEGLVLLMGVLLALAGQAWWQGRVEDQALRGHVSNLLSELEANTAGLEHIIEQHDANVALGSALLRLMGEGDAALRSDSMLALVSPLTLFADFRPATAALDNLVGAGELRLFGDPSLHLAVSRYAGAIADHNVLQAELAQFQINQFMTFLQREVPLLGTEYAGRVLEPRPESRFVFQAIPLARSLEFENLLLRRIRSEGDAADFARRLLASIRELRPALERVR